MSAREKTSARARARARARRARLRFFSRDRALDRRSHARSRARIPQNSSIFSRSTASRATRACTSGRRTARRCASRSRRAACSCRCAVRRARARPRDRIVPRTQTHEKNDAARPARAQAGMQMERLTGGAVRAGMHEVVVLPDTIAAATREAEGRPRGASRRRSSRVASARELRPLGRSRAGERARTRPSRRASRVWAARDPARRRGREEGGRERRAGAAAAGGARCGARRSRAERSRSRERRRWRAWWGGGRVCKGRWCVCADVGRTRAGAAAAAAPARPAMSFSRSC